MAHWRDRDWVPAVLSQDAFALGRLERSPSNEHIDPRKVSTWSWHYHGRNEVRNFLLQCALLVSRVSHDG